MNATLGTRPTGRRRLGVGAEVGRHPRAHVRRRRSHPPLHAQRERGHASLSRAPRRSASRSARATRCSTARSSRSTRTDGPASNCSQQRMHVESAERRSGASPGSARGLHAVRRAVARRPLVDVRAVPRPAARARRAATHRRVVADAAARGRRRRGHLRSQQAVRARRCRRQAPRQHLRARSPLTRVGEGEAHDRTGIRRRRLVARRTRADGNRGFAADRLLRRRGRRARDLRYAARVGSGLRGADLEYLDQALAEHRARRRARSEPAHRRRGARFIDPSSSSR